MNTTACPFVTTVLEEGVLQVGICRPEKKNALSLEMYEAMADALERAWEDNAVRVVLLQGTEACFTSGNDLNDFLRRPPTAPSSPVLRFLKLLQQGRKPIVAAVNGAAVGIGTTLLLHCDLVYAGEGTRFQLPFVSLGLCPEAASSLLLPRLVGHQRASEFFLLGEPFSAARAREAGLVNEVLPADEVLSRARQRAGCLAAQPPDSVRLTRALLRGEGTEVSERMQLEAEYFLERLASPEASEALAAFLQGRRPDFSSSSEVD